MNFQKSLDLSGDRFTVTYSFTCSFEDAVTQAEAISIENTIEFPFAYPLDGIKQIIEQSAAPMRHLRSIFPTPGGGMTIENIPDMLEVYGRDVVLLMGGGLFRDGNDLEANCYKFRELVERI